MGVWVYGYPSNFLLNDIPHNKIWSATNERNFRKGYKYFWRVSVCVILFPISVATFLIGRCLKVKYFFVKKLDFQLIEAIETNQRMLADYLGIKRNEAVNMDFHRVIYHYEYERQERHHTKMDNYVALYGFLRAMALISNCAYIFVLVRYGILTIGDGTEINWFLIILLVGMWFVTYIFFMGFMKFYRRFTLECFMCLITDTSYKITQAVAIPQYIYSSTTGDNFVRVNDE